MPLGRWTGRVLRGLAFSLVVLAVVAGIYAVWYFHRARPTDADFPLFSGIEYRRIVRSDPRPLIVHVATIDPQAPGVEFLATPGDVGHELPFRAKTTSTFLAEHRLQLAINAGFFEPWRDKGPFDYYPRPGDRVRPFGLSVSGGREATAHDPRFVVFSIGADRLPSIGAPPANVVHAVAGNVLLVANATSALTERQRLDHATCEPRTAIALGAKAVMFVVVDGRQPSYSEGVTLAELADLLVELGAETALNLDGGGSSTLVAEGHGTLNWPIHGRHPPGRERPIATHLGVFAKPAPRE